MAKIPWEIIGPVATAVIIILTVVFGFMLRWQKAAKPNPGPSNPPKDLNTVSKKTLCFTHEGRISSNETAIKMLGETLKTCNENNREDHKEIFDKIDDMRERVITEIKKVNGRS